MKTACCFIWLVCLGIQAQIVADHGKFVESFFGGTEQPLGIALLIFFGLGLVEALLLVFWLVVIGFETRHSVRGQQRVEDWARAGQSSKLPRVRGPAIAKLINAFRDRTLIIFDVLRRLGRPLFWFAVIFAVLAALAANLGFNGN